MQIILGFELGDARDRHMPFKLVKHLIYTRSQADVDALTAILTDFKAANHTDAQDLLTLCKAMQQQLDGIQLQPPSTLQQMVLGQLDLAQSAIAEAAAVKKERRDQSAAGNSVGDFGSESHSWRLSEGATQQLRDAPSLTPSSERVTAEPARARADVQEPPAVLRPTNQSGDAAGTKHTPAVSMQLQGATKGVQHPQENTAPSQA
jgi:hypothetical protein